MFKGIATVALLIISNAFMTLAWYGHIVKVEDYTIPTSDVVHRLVIVEKVSPTPRAYPRAFAKIKKAPL